jgi:hypothetical protein
VIVAEPAATAVTLPLASTVATDVLDEVQVTPTLKLPVPATVAVNCCVPPVVMLAVNGLTVTEVMVEGAADAVTFAVADPDLSPCCAEVATIVAVVAPAGAV